METRKKHLNPKSRTGETEDHTSYRPSHRTRHFVRQKSERTETISESSEKTAVGKSYDIAEATCYDRKEKGLASNVHMKRRKTKDKSHARKEAILPESGNNYSLQQRTKGQYVQTTTVKLANPTTLEVEKCDNSSISIRIKHIPKNPLSNGHPKGNRRSSNGKERSRRYHSRKRKRRSLELLGKYRKKKLRSDQADELWEGLPFNLQMPRSTPHTDPPKTISQNDIIVQENADNIIQIEEYDKQLSEKAEQTMGQNLNYNNSNKRNTSKPQRMSRSIVKSNSEITGKQLRGPGVSNTEVEEHHHDLNVTFIVSKRNKKRRRTGRARKRRRRNGKGKQCNRTSAFEVHGTTELSTTTKDPVNTSKPRNEPATLGENVKACDKPYGNPCKHTYTALDEKDTSAVSSSREVTVASGEEAQKGRRRSTRTRKPNQRNDYFATNKHNTSVGHIPEIVHGNTYIASEKASKNKKDSFRVKQEPSLEYDIPPPSIHKPKSQQEDNSSSLQKEECVGKRNFNSTNGESREKPSPTRTKEVLKVKLPSINKALSGAKQRRQQTKYRSKDSTPPKPMINEDMQSKEVTEPQTPNNESSSKIPDNEPKNVTPLGFPLMEEPKTVCDPHKTPKKQTKAKKKAKPRNATPSKSAPLMIKSKNACNIQQRMLSPDSKRHHIRTPSAEANSTKGAADITCKESSSSESKSDGARLSRSSASATRPQADNGVEPSIPRRPLTRRQSLESREQSLLSGLPGPSPEKKKEVAPSYTNLLNDVRLGIHACSLWSSENRRYFHLKNPKANSDVLDDLMRDRWGTLSQKEKLPYYKRAYHATNDRNKHSVSAGSGITVQPDTPHSQHSSERPKESTNLKKRTTPSVDPFYNLPIPQQEQILYQKLMEFQQILPPKQYDAFLQEFVTSFKRVIENEGRRKKESGNAESYHQTLSRRLMYTKLSQYGGFVREVQTHYRYLIYRHNKLAYDELLHRIIRGEQLQFSQNLKSELLTEVLEAIDQVEKREAMEKEAMEKEAGRRVPTDIEREKEMEDGKETIGIKKVEGTKKVENVERNEAPRSVEQKEAAGNLEEKVNAEKVKMRDLLGRKAKDIIEWKEVIDVAQRERITDKAEIPTLSIGKGNVPVQATTTIPTKLGCMCKGDRAKRAVHDIAEGLELNSITGSTPIVIGNERLILPRISVGSVLNEQIVASLNHNISLPRLDHNDLGTYFQELDKVPCIL